MEKNKGYRIEDFEKALPTGAMFDEVVYQSNNGQLVKRVHGQVADVHDGTKSRIQVIWDANGKCYRRTSWMRMPEWDLKLEGDVEGISKK